MTVEKENDKKEMFLLHVQAQCVVMNCQCKLFVVLQIKRNKKGMKTIPFYLESTGVLPFVFFVQLRLLAIEVDFPALNESIRDQV